MVTVPAEPREFDMTNVKPPWRGAPMTQPKKKKAPSQEKSRKQARARARRKMRRGEALMDDALIEIGWKPVEEWDDEELARGRPRNSLGTFTGRKPGWVT